jgi:hypothetical protein
MLVRPQAQLGAILDQLRGNERTRSMDYRAAARLPHAKEPPADLDRPNLEPVKDVPMNLARASQIAEWAVVAAVVLLQAAIFLWPEQSGESGFLLKTAHDAQLFGAIVLILAWSVLGPGWLWVRGGALPLLVGAWFLPWNTRMIPRDTADWFPIAIAATAVVLVIGLRLCGLRVAKSEFTRRGERGAQFSILSLLIATTLIAATVGTLEALRPILSNNIDQLSPPARYVFDSVEDVLRSATIRALVAAAVVSCAAIGGIWVVLRPGAIWLRLAALVVSLGVLGVYLPHLSGVGTEEFTTSATNLSLGLAAVATLTGITVLPLRLLDFRLQRAAGDPSRIVAKPPADSGKQPTDSADRKRLVSRAAALIVLPVLLVVGFLAAHWNEQQRTHSLKSPSRALADWVAPPRKFVITRGSSVTVDFIVDVSLPVEVLEIETSKAQSTP